MKLAIITTRDQKANDFGGLATAPNLALALRSWEAQLNDPRHADADQAKFPEDFAMWHLGDYDSETGIITPLERPVQLAVASDLKRKPDPLPDIEQTQMMRNFNGRRS